MLSPCSHICQVRKFWPCNSLSFLPFTLLSCMIHCVAEIFWILKLQFHSDWSAPVRGCIHSMSECLSVSLNLSQSLCGVEGLSVTSHLLWWFKTQVMYVELESFDPAKYSFLPSFLPCMIHFLAVFLYILKIQCSSNCSTAVRGCIHIMWSECLSVSLNLVQHFWVEWRFVSFIIPVVPMFDTCQSHITSATCRKICVSRLHEMSNREHVARQR